MNAHLLHLPLLRHTPHFQGLHWALYLHLQSHWLRTKQRTGTETRRKLPLPPERYICCNPVFSRLPVRGSASTFDPSDEAAAFLNTPVLQYTVPAP